MVSYFDKQTFEGFKSSERHFGKSATRRSKFSNEVFETTQSWLMSARATNRDFPTGVISHTVYRVIQDFENTEKNYNYNSFLENRGDLFLEGRLKV